MTQNASIHIRPRRAEDDATIAAIRHAWEPEYPEASAERLAAQFESNGRYGRQCILVAALDGQVVGEGYLLQMYWSDSPAAYLAQVCIAPEWGGRGIGGELYEHVRRQATEWGAEMLSTDVREDHPIGMAFAHRRGFQDTGHGSRMSRLDLDQVDLAGYDGLPEHLEESGIRVMRLADVAPRDEPFLRELHAMHLAAAADEPTPHPLNTPFEAWRDGLVGQPGVSPETIWIAFHGDRPIGITLLQSRGPEAGWLFGMSVDRAFRGQGVARLLKLRQTEWARDSGLRYLYTANSADNPRMYDINMRLGFKPLPAVITLELKLQPA